MCSQVWFWAQISSCIVTLVVWKVLPNMAGTCLWLPGSHGFISVQWEGLLISWNHNIQVAQSPWSWYSWRITGPEVFHPARPYGEGCSRPKRCWWRLDLNHKDKHPKNQVSTAIKVIEADNDFSWDCSSNIGDDVQVVEPEASGNDTEVDIE